MLDCVFCKIVAGSGPAQIVHEDDLTLAFLDRFPQTRGHLQLIPKKHYRWVYEVPFVAKFFSTAADITRGIIPVLGADHVSWGTFGHQVHHAHLWIVPQYKKQVRIGEGLGKAVTDLQSVADLLRRSLNPKF